MPDLPRVHHGSERLDKHRIIADLKDGRRVDWAMQTACANAGQIVRWLLVPPSIAATGRPSPDTLGSPLRQSHPGDEHADRRDGR